MPRRVMSIAGLSGLLVVVQAALAGPALSASGWTAYVGNFGANTVTQVSTATNTTFGTAIPVGTGPLGIAITPDGKTAYVTNNADGTVTPISTVTNAPGTAIPVGKNPRGIAITPDGKTAYVANNGDDTVTPITIATNAAQKAIPVSAHPGGVAITPDGKIAYVNNSVTNTVTPINTATNTPGTPITVGAKPVALAITPDGKTIYVANSTDNTVTPISTATNTVGTAIPVGNQPFWVAITPDGKTVYVSNNGSTTVTPISAATNTAGTAITVGAAPEELAATPDGKTVYVPNEVDDSVSPVNTTTNTAGTAIPFGIGAQPSAIAVTPDQAPSAAFSAAPAPAGQATGFDGSASSSPVGSIASYQWDFGDGQSATTTTPVTSHVFAQPKAYTSRLTVINSAGTSLGQVFTGQTVSNQGGPQASTTRAFTVVTNTTSGTGSKLSTLRISPNSAPIGGRKVTGRCVKATTKNKRHKSCRLTVKLHVTYKLTAAAKVTFTIKREDAGRKSNGRCVKPTRKNRKHKRCTRLTAMSGKITQTGVAGANSFNFNGKIGGRKLGRAHYRLTASVSGGNSQTIKFRIGG